MIYFTSDLHFNHNKPFIYEPRGFTSVEEMNEVIIAKFNSVVSPDDEVYILGDLILGGSDAIEDGIGLLERLNGTIHIVRGNHDTDNRWSAYIEKCGWTLDEAQNSIYFKWEGYHFYLSHYPTITSNLDYDKPLKQRTLNLCGHTHTKDKWCDSDKGYIYHVELDAHDCRPVSIEQIIKDFKDMYGHKKNEERQIKMPTNEMRIFDRNMFKMTTCYYCVWDATGGCPGPNKYPATCPDGWIYKRDPPDGGYYG